VSRTVIRLPRAITVVNDGSSLAVTLTHLDAFDAPAAPDTLRYRLDDPLGGELIGWTSVDTPASTNSVTIPASANTTRCSPYVLRQLTVEAVIGGQTAVDEITYQVRALAGVA
jgi:hypothetical protein